MFQTRGRLLQVAGACVNHKIFINVGTHVLTPERMFQTCDQTSQTCRRMFEAQTRAQMFGSYTVELL